MQTLPNALALILIALLLVEAAMFLPLGSAARGVRDPLRRTAQIRASSKISDVWKSRAIAAYHRRTIAGVFALTLCFGMLGFIALALCGIVSIALPGLVTFAASVPGVAILTATPLVYIAFRRRATAAQSA